MNKLFFFSMIMAVVTPATLKATILYEATNVTYAPNTLPSINLTTPMAKTDTYYIQYTVELTSTVPPYISGDGNNKNHSYPYVANYPANSSSGAAAFLFYIGGGYNSDYLLTTGFTTSTWQSNQFSASDAVGASPRQSTGMVAQYSTPVDPSIPGTGTVKFQVDMTLRMGSGTYDYTISKLNGSGAVLQTATLTGLDMDTGGNFWRNNSSFSTINFASSTSHMTSKFDRIIVSDTAIAPIPEPGTFVLAGAGIAFLSLSRRRRKA